MTCYPVYLEVADNRPWTAHVLDLPGCFARAATREAVLEQLPQVIRDYHTWLRQHGEPAPSEEQPIEIEIAGEVSGFSVSNPGDKAALFAPERAPITMEDVERHFRLMAHSRDDLLALVAGLPDAVLDWQASPESFSVRGLLRHIGSAEQWYVSRLVSPETLPVEWEDDKDMPLFEFLEMERRTALPRLRQLTTEERSTVFTPTHRTAHPDEPWTVRKALRRFLEHEREHFAQIKEILEMHRRYPLANQAAARAGLLRQLCGLDDHTLTEETIHGDWTLRDVMAHLAAWDRCVLRELRKLVAGERPDLTPMRNIHGYNAASVASWRGRSLDEVVDELHAARADWVAWMENLPPEIFFRRHPVGRSRRNWSPPMWTDILKEHDAEHAKEIAAWREEQGLKRGVGPKLLLRITIAASRAELLASASLVPVQERASRPVCGEWTVKDLLAHVAAWDRVGAEGMRLMLAGQPPHLEEQQIEDYDGWNQALFQARRDESWEDVWADLHAARQEILEILEEAEQAGLGRLVPVPWGREATPYDWIGIFIDHDRDHARDVREAVLGTEQTAEE